MAERKTGEAKPVVWILVDHSSREAAFASVAQVLQAQGVSAEIVTITEVIGSMARDALAGGAERLLRGLRVAVKGRGGDEDLLGAIRRAQPDVLAVTDPRYVRPLGLLESLTGIPSLQVGVLADYNLSPGWTRSSVQAFVVPHEDFRARLEGEGVASERVLVAGPAIQAGFAREIDRAADRQAFGFGEESVVLVRADAFDPGLLEKLVFQSTLAERGARFLFHHAGDQATATVLRRAASQYGLKASMFGKVDDLERYVNAADLVVAAPSEPFAAEIIARDRPLLFVGPEGGHAAQVDFLTRQGAARHVGDVLRLGSEMDRALESAARSEAEAAAAKLSQTAGSEQVAEALLEALAHREQWRHPASTAAPPPSGDKEPEADGEEAPATEAGPFETIGGGVPTGASGAEEGVQKGEGGREESTPSFAGLSRAEAKDQLAALILSERDLERRLDEADKQQQRWRGRLELAREWGEDDLAEEAEGILRGHIAEAERLQADLQGIRRQKAKLKEAAGRGAAAAGSAGSTGAASGSEAKNHSDMEKRFRQMEVDSDLEDLKDRIRKELGE